MTTRNLDTGAFKTRLLSRIEELDDEMTRLQADLKDLGSEQAEESGSGGNHLAEEGSSVGEQDRILTVLNDIRAMRDEASSAVERIEDDTFGTCVSCQKPIRLERLKAFPWVARCINCQSELERRAEY